MEQKKGIDGLELISGATIHCIVLENQNSSDLSVSITLKVFVFPQGSEAKKIYVQQPETPNHACQAGPDEDDSSGAPGSPASRTAEATPRSSGKFRTVPLPLRFILYM